MHIVFGVFIVLHGLVHLLYAGQAMRFFELRSGIVWPDGAWLFSRLVGDETTRLLAAVLLAVTAFAFAAGGLGSLLRQEWWRPVTVGAGLLSALVFLLMWDGQRQALAVQGGVGVLISLALVAVAPVFWPQV